ncbi:unnamed protein product [Rotaria sordida]|uniref:Uncharacterized protein n=1 Tax=Rotaria sordida TaxID=392033 RepID=A0A815JUK3_9BILA|nr:unnamed protein product [Rotaria sordida]CAF1384584.1 unnamed protein product [Rotaria sordida]
MENYLQALLFYEKALEIQQTILPPNYSDLIITYNNIALICNSMGDYSKELSCYENILQIQLKSLSTSDPTLINTYNNLARVYSSTKDYLHAIAFYKKTLKIQQAILPVNDPLIAITYNNIGRAHADREYYSYARDSYQEALKIQENILDPNDPLLAETYNNVGEMYRLTGNCLDALQYFEKALQIQEKILDSNHPSLVTTKNNIDQSFLSNDTSFHMRDDNMPTTSEGFHQYEETTLESSQTLNTITHNIESNHSQAGEYQEYANQRTTIVSSGNLHEKKVDKQWIYPVLLVLSSPETARLYSILKNITDSCLIPPIQTDECNDKLKSYQQIKELVLEFPSNISVTDRDRILSEISSFDNIQSIYLLGKPPETKKQRNEFFNQFDKVCIFCEDEEQIAVQWILDTASRCRMFGNQCIKTGDKAVASEHFQRGIELYERLKEFMKPK